MILSVDYFVLLEVFGEGDSGSDAPLSKSSTQMTVWFMCPGYPRWADGIDKFAGDLRATHPHFAYAPHASPQALHNAGCLTWGSGPRGGVPTYTGLDVIIVRDEKIAALYVFLNSPPA